MSMPEVNCFYIEDEPYYGLEKGDVYVRAETVKKVRLYLSVSTGEALEIIEALIAAAAEIDL